MRHKFSEGGDTPKSINAVIDEFVQKLNDKYGKSYLYRVEFGKKYAKIIYVPLYNGKPRLGRSCIWGFVVLEDDKERGLFKGDLPKTASSPAKGPRGNLLKGNAQYDKYGAAYRLAEGGEVEGNNIYNAYYKGKEIEVRADSSYQAQKKAAAEFKAKKTFDVTVVLAQKGEEDVIHSTSEFAEGGEVEEDNKSKQIAKEILAQLGGMNRLNSMTGAYGFSYIKSGVQFHIKNPKANFIKIVYTSMDLYDLEVGRLRGGTYKVVYELKGIYAEDLKKTIEQATGMRLSLFASGGEVQPFEFSFKTDEDLADAEKEGYVEPYDIVRIVVEKDGDTWDIPAKTEQEYLTLLDIHTGNITKQYQDLMYFDIAEYDECELCDEFREGGVIHKQGEVSVVEILDDPIHTCAVKYKDKLIKFPDMFAAREYLHENSFLSGGHVKFVPEKDKYNTWWGRKGVKQESKCVGEFDLKHEGRGIHDFYLYELNAFDKNYYKDVNLKDGERMYRYETDTIKGIYFPLVKVNVKKGLIYFLADMDNDEAVFNTKGVKPMYLSLHESEKMKHGGKISGKKKFKKFFEDFNIYAPLRKLKKEFKKFESGGAVGYVEKGGFLSKPERDKISDFSTEEKKQLDKELTKNLHEVNETDFHELSGGNKEKARRLMKKAYQQAYEKSYKKFGIKYEGGGIVLDEEGEPIGAGSRVTNGRGLVGKVIKVQENGLLYIQWTDLGGEPIIDLTSDNDPSELIVLN